MAKAVIHHFEAIDIEATSGARLILETFDLIGIDLGENLDRYFTLQTRVPRFVNLPHSARPDDGDRFVWAN
jgi:hypothetical protein